MSDDLITLLAGALYETDPPESWMRTGTDEYRKRAAAMLEVITNTEREAFIEAGATAVDGLRKAVEALHSWDMTKGWHAHNAIVEQFDALLSAGDKAEAPE